MRHTVCSVSALIGPVAMAALGAALANNASAAGVAVAPVSQIRVVGADSFVVNGASSQQDLVEIPASDLGPFIETLDTFATASNGTATFSGSQDSHFAPFGIEAHLNAYSTSTIVAPGGFCYSVGTASCQVVFDLAATTTCRINATLTAGAQGQAKLLLVGPGGTALSKNLTGDAEVVRTTLGLPAGRYTLLASSFASTSLGPVGTQTDETSLSLHLSTSASPADLDLDGIVGAADLAELLGAWGACEGCPSDLNGDGAVGPMDLAGLLGAWGG